MSHWHFCALARSSILDHDLDILRLFAMMLRNNLTALSFDEMSYTFSNAGMETLTKTRSHARYLSRFEPIKLECCVNSCVCFTGLHASLNECPRCKMSCLNKSGEARQTFSYMPLIPHLCAFMSNCAYATCLQYHADEHAKTH